MRMGFIGFRAHGLAYGISSVDNTSITISDNTLSGNGLAPDGLTTNLAAFGSRVERL